MNGPYEIPLFPLNVVLFPAMVLPLHIFEERYKLMINECIEEKSEFGIVYGTDEHFAEVGCAAVVTALIERLPDGRLNILTTGTRRFRIIERFTGSSSLSISDSKPYISAMAGAFEDEDEEADPEICEKVSLLYGEALRLTSGWAHPESIRRTTPTPESLSFLVAAHLGMGLDEKQAILEMRSVNARLLRLAHVLEQSLSGLREMKRRIGGNGHLA